MEIDYAGKIKNSSLAIIQATMPTREIKKMDVCGLITMDEILSPAGSPKAAGDFQSQLSTKRDPPCLKGLRIR